MVALARDPVEERRFRAMAFLLDPQHDRSVLTATAQPAPKADQPGREGMLKAVQAMRRGQHRTALQVAARPAVKLAWESFADVLSYDDFLGLPAETIPAPQLIRLLTLELLLSQGAGSTSGGGGQAAAAWAEAVARKETAPVRDLTLQTLTEFDPRECLFRNGRWVRPAAAP
jgi:hypothetical protein